MPNAHRPPDDELSASSAVDFAVDVIVLGAGSAGCVLAGELAAEPGLSILVLEAGPPAEAHPETLAADGYKKAFVNDAVMWDRVSTPQPGCTNNRIFLGSGKVSGGSASINGMVYTRGDRRDYDEWGIPGWSWDDLVPSFRAIEERIGPRRMPPTRFSEVCITAAEQVDFHRKEDLNDGDLRGFLGYEWMNQDGTHRLNSYVRFLKPHLDRPAGIAQGIAVAGVDGVDGGGGSVRLLNHALVQKIVIEGGRATAVKFLHNGRVHTATAKREIVLCAGALESPKLLMLSGVGPKEVLQRHGIAVQAPLQGVGRNLQDHPNVSLFFAGRAPTDYSFPQLYGFHRAGPVPDRHISDEQADTCYVFYTARSSFREGVLRLLPLIALPLVLYRVAFFRAFIRALVVAAFLLPPLKRLIERMYGVVVILGKPKSRGHLELSSTDPAEPARIDPAYFSDPADLDTLYRGAERARRIVASPALAGWGNKPILPNIGPGGGARTEAALRRFIRKQAMTTYHYGGTCRMGARPEDGAVVDAQLRVHGVRGLRVADASIFPTVPVSALNASSMLVGYRGAHLILESLREALRAERAEAAA